MLFINVTLSKNQLYKHQNETKSLPSAALFRCGHLLFTCKTHCGLKFHFGQFDPSKICTEVSFTTPEVMWTLTMKLPHSEVKFYPDVKSQTGLSSLRVSCKLGLKQSRCWKKLMHHINRKWTAAHFSIFYSKIWVGFRIQESSFVLEVSFESQQKEHRLF